MGASGMDSLSIGASRALFSADVIYTSNRLARMLPPPLRGKVVTWPVPFSAVAEKIERQRREGRKVAVVATSNPFYYGVGVVLARHFPPEEIEAWPAPSAFALAAARLGWAEQDVFKISLHGRQTCALEPLLVERSRIFLLTEPHTLYRVAERLKRRNLLGSRVIVLADLGGPEEQIHELTVEEAQDFDDAILSLPHVIALDCQYANPETDFHPLACSRAAGLAEECFEHDGQITKAPVRAITVNALMPRARTLLWDIGAGCGSVAIEWLRMAGHTAHAIAIERDARRCRMIERNADALGAPRLRVVHGAAPEALKNLPRPDVVFLGGGVADEAVFEGAWAALPKGGWLVANAVSLAAEQALLARHARLGGELMRIQISRADTIGPGPRQLPGAGAREAGAAPATTAAEGMAEARAAPLTAEEEGHRAFRHALPITQWRVRKR